MTFDTVEPRYEPWPREGWLGAHVDRFLPRRRIVGYVAMMEQGCVATSADGITWSIPARSSPDPFGHAWLVAEAWRARWGYIKAVP